MAAISCLNPLFGDAQSTYIKIDPYVSIFTLDAMFHNGRCSLYTALCTCCVKPRKLSTKALELPTWGYVRSFSHERINALKIIDISKVDRHPSPLIPQGNPHLGGKQVAQ